MNGDVLHTLEKLVKLSIKHSFEKVEQVPVTLCDIQNFDTSNMNFLDAVVQFLRPMLTKCPKKRYM